MNGRRRRPGHLSHKPRGTDKRRWQQANERKDALPERQGCPHPGKRAFAGRKEARAAIKAMKAVGNTGARGRLHAYKCRCGSFHCGTASLKPGPAPELPA